MREDLEYVDIATLTKIKMWYYNSRSLGEERGDGVRTMADPLSNGLSLLFL